MADDIAITPGTGATVATDQVGTRHFQLFKLDVGGDGVSTPISGNATRGLPVDPRSSVVRLAQTPTVSNGAIYAAKDAIGGRLTFANAARASGLPVRLDAVQIEDKGQQMAQMDLVLFDRTFTAPTDNAVFAPTDAELATCVGVVPVVTADWKDFSTNSVASLRDLGLWIVLNGTDLFGGLVSRGTPTYTSTSDIVVTVTVTQA